MYQNRKYLKEKITFKLPNKMKMSEKKVVKLMTYQFIQSEISEKKY